MNVQRVPNRNTRRADGYKFYTEKYNVVKYKKSLFYKGAEQLLWDKLRMPTIVDTLFDLKVCVKKEIGHYATS